MPTISQNSSFASADTGKASRGRTRSESMALRSNSDSNSKSIGR
jgi:hypothetical protein